jgi:UDP-N-acetylglucosamine--N-acetylmuramyl-(pentapeptide) pyrophosphoryl-undecaprenol N-acetylglucosamine transferase
METYFQKEKIVFTGNPVRGDIISLEEKSKQMFANYSLDSEKKTILIVGGSLGARTVNEAILANATQLESLGVQVLWQCGSFYYKEIKERLAKLNTPNIHLREFIYDMDKAYTVADIIVSRAGALSISELCLVAKPTILVPSPNVAEDHQTKNAMALVNENAAVMVKDTEIEETLVSILTDLLQNIEKCQSLSENIKSLGKPNAAKDIVKTIFEF